MGNRVIGVVDPSGMADRIIPDEEIKRLEELRDKYNGYADRVDHESYTTLESIVDFLHYLIHERKDDYFGSWDNDEERFATDCGFVLGGIDAHMGFWGYVYHSRQDTRFMGKVYPEGGFSGFKDELNDNSNTIRHVWAAIVFAYDYGDTLGTIGGWWRDREDTPDKLKDRRLAYVGADLGEELDDVSDPLGWDLDDFDQGFAKYFATEEVYERLANKYGW